MKKKKAIIGWILVIIVMGVIYYFSDQESVQSSGTSNGITNIFLSTFNLEEVFDAGCFNGLIRKVAHFSIYALLGLFVYYAVFNSWKFSLINILILSIFIVMLYASFDEIHQLFVLGRSGELRDVFIDSSGGSIGALIYYLYLKV